MLKANVGLSRKLSKDYQSTGFSVNLEGEITAPASDAEVVIEQIKELFDLAEETLNQQIQRSASVEAIGGRDASPQQTESATNGHSHQENGADTNDTGGGDDQATAKQINFLLAIGKRQRLSTAALETKIGDVLGYSVGVYDLTKRQAGVVLAAFTKNGQEATSSRS
jgi:hypothetical protein